MIRVVILVALLVYALLPAICAAQVHFSLPFLIIPASDRANAMGGAGAAVLDPSIAYFNPGGLGVLALSGQSSIVYNSHPRKGQYSLEYRNVFVVAGLSLPSEENLHGFHYSLAAGFHRQSADYGSIARTDELGNITGRIDIYDRSNNFTVAGGIKNGAELGVGLTLKRYTSALGGDPADGFLRDIGAFVRVPLIETARRFGLIAAESPSALAYDGVIAFSYAWANRGSDIKYIDAQEGDPPPRLDRVGMSAEAFLDYHSARVAGIVLARDDEHPRGYEQYTKVVEHTGMEVDFLGIVRLQSGSYDQGYGRTGTTKGFSIHVRGAGSWLAILMNGAPTVEQPHWTRRVDIYYQQSELDGDGGQLPTGVAFKEIGVTLELGSF